ncbi:DNA primase [Acetobacteraceae bacterium]|nr:DNA primase [Acetobacteraceae bacterium]
MRFEPSFLDELKSRLSLSSIIGRRVKLTRSGKDWKGCCPFHGEKTASFYVYDDHYHCFGCGAHGDAIGFVHQTQGGTFADVVERLAGEAGLALPAPDIHAEEKREVRRQLSDVLEAARLYYRDCLHAPEGRAAREYLAARGISQEIAERFSFGWAESGNALVAHLETQGFSKSQMKETGILRDSQNGGDARPFFFNRVMIPIFGRKKEVLSFGGRVLDESKPKYLNGPETPLFSKKHILFNFEQARNFIDRQSPIIVVEGYMDVVALSQQGIGGVVAPLGTAVTEDQLRLLWRSSEAPVFCFDGDSAGRRAAFRVCEVAFPLLETGKRLKFCFLPKGEDPDSMVRKEGKEIFWKRVENALSLDESYFGLLAEKIDPEGADSRAQFRKALTEASERIKDNILGSEYRASWMDRFFSHFRFSGTQKTKGAWQNNRERNQSRFRQYQQISQTKSVFSPPQILESGSNIIAFSKASVPQQRYEILFGILMQHPEIFPWIEEAFSRLDFGGNRRLLALQDRMFEWYEQEEVREEDAEGSLKRFLEANDFSEEVKKFASLGNIDTEGAPIVESWWHFYGFIDIKSFDQSVRRDIERELLNDERVEESDSPKTFSKALLARIEARDRLRRGEMPDMPAGENLSPPP